MSDTAYGWPWAICVELQVIHSLWLPLLGLRVHGKDQAAHQVQLLQAPGPGVGQQKFQDTPKLIIACWLPVRLSL